MNFKEGNIIILILLSVLVLQGCSNSDFNGNTTPIPPLQTVVNDWTRQPIEFKVDLRDIYFYDKGLGWAVGNIESIFTSTGGQVWSLVPVSDDDESVYRSVFFVDAENGWMVGDLASDTAKGQIAYSGNGGAYPIQQAVVDAPLNAVFFTDRNTGWAAGNGGLIVYTNDGGRTWETGDMGTTDSVYGLFFTDKTKGWAVTANGGIFHTNDGLNWVSDSSGVTTDLRAIQFTDSLHGFICGDQNTILFGTAGPGNTFQWTKSGVTDVPENLMWKDISFVDPSTGWVIGKFRNIYKTVDGGITWEPETVDNGGELNAIYMVSKTKGWIAGDKGTMLTYTPRD